MEAQCPQLVPFQNLMGRVLAGEPFSERYAVFSTLLLTRLGTAQPGDNSHDEELVWRWVERNDAQNYIVLGDPAARIRVNGLHP